MVQDTHALQEFEAWPLFRVIKLPSTSVVHHEAAMPSAQLFKAHVVWPLFQAVYTVVTDFRLVAVHVLRLSNYGNAKLAVCDGKRAADVRTHVHLSSC